MVVLTLVAIGVVTALVIAAWKLRRRQLEPEDPEPARRPTARRRTHRELRSHGDPRDGTAPSLLEVRKGWATGDVLFQGTLERGEAQRFTAKRLWLAHLAAGEPRVEVNGQVASLGRAVRRSSSVTRRQVTSKSACG